jgi:hypothetical protein
MEKNGFLKLTFTIFVTVMSLSSCITYSGAWGKTGLIIAGPNDFKHQKIISNVILPYIADVLDYNDPNGTADPSLQANFRSIASVNNMNYDDVVNCQDYALLFYALCKYYNIPVKYILNYTLQHAYNQIYFSLMVPLDIEPQGGEAYVYVEALKDTMHQQSEQIGIGVLTTYTHPDNFERDPLNWIDTEGASPPNLELLNYVIENGKLPD